MAEQAYKIESVRTVNEEGSDFVTVTIRFADGSEVVERFASYFDDPSASALEQAASFVAAFEETQRYTLEELLGPFGIEWAREQHERERGW
jgi:hypothetical protein